MISEDQAHTTQDPCPQVPVRHLGSLREPNKNTNNKTMLRKLELKKLAQQLIQQLSNSPLLAIGLANGDSQLGRLQLQPGGPQEQHPLQIGVAIAQPEKSPNPKNMEKIRISQRKFNIFETIKKQILTNYCELKGTQL